MKQHRAILQQWINIPGGGSLERSVMTLEHCFGRQSNPIQMRNHRARLLENQTFVAFSSESHPWRLQLSLLSCLKACAQDCKQRKSKCKIMQCHVSILNISNHTGKTSLETQRHNACWAPLSDFELCVSAPPVPLRLTGFHA